jgi:hypothetical protein
MLTKLDAINVSLAAIGIDPVSGEDSRHPAYLRAKRNFDTELSTMLSNGGKGYWFNRSTVEPAGPSVTIPSNAIVFRCLSDPLIVVRDGKLFHMTTRMNVSPEGNKFELIEDLPFEYIPASAQDYVKNRARYIFFVNNNGSDPKLSVYRDEMVSSANLLRAEDLNNKNLNYFDRPYADREAPHHSRYVRG